jgi:hypothetical protein
VYFNKRKLYLAALSEVLSSSKLCSSIQVSYFKSDHRKPYLVVKPNFKSTYSIRIYPSAPTGVFKLIQLLSSKNNVRPDSWIRELKLRRSEPGSSIEKDKAKDKLDQQLDPSSLAPTPHYNMAILEDLAIVPQSRMLIKAAESCSCFKDVCILLKVGLCA